MVKRNCLAEKEECLFKKSPYHGILIQYMRVKAFLFGRNVESVLGSVWLYGKVLLTLWCIFSILEIGKNWEVREVNNE